jgi:hypothetical protein
MAKAHIDLPDGTKVAIEGSSEEVAFLLSKYGAGSKRTAAQLRSKTDPRRSKTRTRESSRKGPTSLITDLVAEGFFKSRRSLSEIQKKLEETGHIYAQTSLSPILVRLVRKRDSLRRLKEKKGWVYVR